MRSTTGRFLQSSLSLTSSKRLSARLNTSASGMASESSTATSMDQSAGKMKSMILSSVQQGGDVTPLIIPAEQQLLCPIGGKRMVEPVVASDGFTYERVNLEKLLNSLMATSPLTGEKLDKNVMIPNLTIKKLIEKQALSETTFLRSITPPLVVSNIKHPSPLFNCRISSNLADLDRLHAQHEWIPNSTQIRPTPKTLERKHKYFLDVIPQYKSEKDFLLHTIFDMPIKKVANREEATSKIEVEHPVQMVWRQHSLRRTIPNMFPYNVPDQTLHFVHWIYPHYQEAGSNEVVIDESETNRAIENQLAVYFGPRTKFEFAWDLNPKMSLPHEKTGILHIHVFARILAGL